MVSGLAVSGYDNLSSSIMQGSSFDGTFSQKAASVFNIVNNVYSIYDQADGRVLRRGLLCLYGLVEKTKDAEVQVQNVQMFRIQGVAVCKPITQ